MQQSTYDSPRVTRNSSGDAVINFLAAYTAAVTHNALQWAKQSHKIGSCLRNLDPSKTWFFGPTRVSSPRAARSDQLFLQVSPLCPTDTQTHTERQTTLCVTSVEIGCIYAMHAMGLKFRGMRIYTFQSKLSKPRQICSREKHASRYNLKALAYSVSY